MDMLFGIQGNASIALGLAAAMAVNTIPLLLVLLTRRSRNGFLLWALALAPVFAGLLFMWGVEVSKPKTWPGLVVRVVRCRFPRSQSPELCQLQAGFLHGLEVTKRMLLRM